MIDWQYTSATDWSLDTVAGIPQRWQYRLLKKFNQDRFSDPENQHVISRKIGPFFKAGHDLVALVETMRKLRITLDAPDWEICTRAEQLALETLDSARCLLALDLKRRQMEDFVESCGIECPDLDMEDRPAIARMSCPLWWRRALRKLHARAVESAAINLGYVHRNADLYCSNETLQRRLQQNSRNNLILENTVMENEDGQHFKLAELAATGVSNKSIRRGELMTRINGMEKIAKELQHSGLFITLTCPSRMHKWTDLGDGKVVENKKYDGTKPNEAQAYLSKIWSRIRAKLARDSIRLYGFRIAEPHHDGCPHWHLLFFLDAAHDESVRGIFTRYALTDSPDEPGAKKHRIKFLKIDWSKGSAAGYIAKYLAKNIDGYKVGQDLYGNDAIESSARVEAWATTWRIRQFQQIGGAPVGVWRELRRIKSIPAQAPDFLHAAHATVSKGVANDETKQADWAAYEKAQGRIITGAPPQITIAKKEVGGLGRYFEPMADRVIGVICEAVQYIRHGIIPAWPHVVSWVVESSRHVWRRVANQIRIHSENSDSFCACG